MDGTTKGGDGQVPVTSELAEHLLNGTSYRRPKTVKVQPHDLIVGEVLSLSEMRNGNVPAINVIEVRVLEPSTAGGVEVAPGEWLRLQVSAAPLRRLLAEQPVAPGWRFALQYRDRKGDVVVGAAPPDEPDTGAAPWE